MLPNDSTRGEGLGGMIVATIAMGIVMLAAVILATLLVGCGGSSKPRPPQPPPVSASCAPSAPLSSMQLAERMGVEECVGRRNPLAVRIGVRPTKPCGNGAPGCIDVPCDSVRSIPGVGSRIGSAYCPECGPAVYVGTSNARFDAAYWNHAMRHEFGHHAGLDQGHTDQQWRACGLM